MDQIKRISIEELKVIAGKHQLDLETISKDYYLTALLFTISQIDGLYFKGGTALYKIHLNHLRMSEDLDFTVIGNLKEIEQKIIDEIGKQELFGKVEYDKRTENFIRLLISYKSSHNKKDTIIIDLNSKATVVLPPDKREVMHFYPDYIPSFTINTLNLKELIAEKIRSVVERYAARDYFDVYQIIKAKLPIDTKLLKTKFKEVGQDFDIGRIFKRGQKIFNTWEKDVIPLTSNPVSFEEVMQTLADFFKYKEYKSANKDGKRQAKQ